MTVGVDAHILGFEILRADAVLPLTGIRQTKGIDRGGTDEIGAAKNHSIGMGPLTVHGSQYVVWCKFERGWAVIVGPHITPKHRVLTVQLIVDPRHDL